MDPTSVTRRAASRLRTVSRAAMVSAAALLAAAGGAPCADLVVAHIAPYSGRNASIGREYGQGARLYFDHVNAHGGVRGANVILDARDDGGDPELTRMQAASVAALRPVAFIGTVGADNVKGLYPTLEKLDAPLLAPVVDSAGVAATRHRNVFHVRPDLPQEIDAVYARLYDFGMRNIVICAPAGDLPQPADAARAKRHAAAASVVRCDGDASRTAAAARAIAATGNAQAVIYAGPAQEAAAFVEALRGARSYAMVVTSSAIDPVALARALPPSARIWLAIAEIIPNPGVQRSSVDPIVDEFRATRASDHSDIPLSRETLAGFMAAKLAVDAIRRAGDNPTAANVHRALADMRSIRGEGAGVALAGREMAAGRVTLGILGSNGTVLN